MPAAKDFGLFVAGVAAAVLVVVALTAPLGPTAPPGSAVPRTPTAETEGPLVTPSTAASTPPWETVTPSRTLGLDEGNLAPDFTLPSLAGGSVSLSDYRGHAVWINFWAPWCPACITEMPRLEEFWVQWRAAGLVILGVGVKDSPERMREFARIRGVDYPIAVDEDGAVAARYRAIVLPVHYWIDREGVVSGWAFGELPPDVLLSALQKILPEAGR